MILSIYTLWMTVFCASIYSEEEQNILKITRREEKAKVGAAETQRKE